VLADLKHPDRVQYQSILAHILSLAASEIRLDILDWAEANVVFPHSDRSTTFQRSFAKWWNPVLQAFASGNFKVVSVVGPTGAGKTTVIETLTAFIIAQNPGPALLVSQSDDDVADWAEERLMPMLESITAVRALMPLNRHKKRKMEIAFPHMMLRLGGANLTTLQSKSCRFVILDEVWLFGLGLVKEAFARLHDRANGILLALGQAGIIGDEHHQLHETTLKHDYGWSCPNCQEWIAYSCEREQLKYDSLKTEKGEWDIPGIIKSVRLECPKCQANFSDTEHNRRRLSDSGSFRALEDNNPWPERIGFHLNVLAVWWVPWSNIVLEFILAHDRIKAIGDKAAMRQWKQKRCAEFWSDDDEAPRIQLQAGQYGLGQYLNGELIDSEMIRFLTVDRQLGHFWALIRAWRADGSSRLLYFDRINDWTEITALAKRYKVIPTAVAVDCRYDSGNVYSFCARGGHLAFRGDRLNSWNHVIRDKPPVKKPFSPFQTIAIDGRACYALSFSNLHCKDVLALLRMGRLRPFEVPNDIQSVYSEQMSCEIRKDVAGESGPSQRWVAIGSRSNHAWDCEVQQVVFAISCDIIRLNEQFGVDLDLSTATATATVSG